MPYLVKILVERKPGVFNPEAVTIEKSANSRGYAISDFSCGREFSYKSKKTSEIEARTEADAFAKGILTNPVIEKYEIVSIKRIV